MIKSQANGKKPRREIIVWIVEECARGAVTPGQGCRKDGEKRLLISGAKQKRSAVLLDKEAPSETVPSGRLRLPQNKAENKRS